MPSRPRTASPRYQSEQNPGPRGANGVDVLRGAQTVQVDGNAMAAPAMGIAKIGEGIGQAGGVLMQVAEAKQRADDVTAEHAAKMAMLKGQQAMNQEIAQEPNQNKWQEIYDRNMQLIGSSVDTALTDNMASNSAKKSVGRVLEEQKMRWGGDVRIQALRQSKEKAGQSYVAIIDTNILTGNAPGMEKAVDDAVAQGYMEPAVGEYTKQAGREKIRVNVEQAQKKAAIDNGMALIAKDPKQALAIFRNPGTEMRPDVKAQLDNLAEAAVRNRTAGLASSVADRLALPDGDANKITTPEQIDEAAKADPEYYTPRMVEASKADLGQRQQAGFAQRMQVEGPQIASGLLSEIKEMDPKVNTQEEFFAMRLKIDQLPTSLRADLDSALKFSWQGEGDGRSKNPMKGLGDDILQQGLLSGMYGQTEKWQDEKFLNDEKDPSKGDYRKYDADSPNTFKGKYVPDPAAKAQAITRKAEAGARFYRWLDQNPKATEQQVKDFIWNDSQESIRAGLPDQYQKGWDFISGPVQDARAAAVIQGTSVKPASAPDPMNAPNTSTGNTEGGTEGEATFFQGGKITSYGYKNDETPDQNSSDGIGAFVPDAEAKKIRAGQDSTYKLRAGDLAISPDVEESFREKGIKPGDRVTITYGNGSKHTGRWMDRTANDKQAEKLGLKPLRGRFDIYSPNGRHAKDGVKVVSFARVG